jgi:hypothetical protein
VKLPEFTLVHQRWQARGDKAGRAGAERAAFAGSPPPTKASRVGIWDLGAYVGRLPQVIEAVNRAQNELVFYEALAAMPTGTVSQPSRVRAWSKALGGPRRLPGLLANVIAEDFFKRAERVRRDLGLDYLAGLTAKMIADEDAEQVYYNLLAAARSRLILVSTCDLRKYAARAGRPFESAVVGLVVAEVLTLLHRRLEFHPDRGCLFDYNEDRAGIVKVLKDPRIEDSCLQKIPLAHRPAAVALVEALRQYPKGGPS